MNITRVWAMPSSDTFDISPIGDFVKKYLRQSKVSVDPFARNKRWATYTNDLNPETAAEYHLDARDFLQTLIDKDIPADLVLFDPPYSLHQAKVTYDALKFKPEWNWMWNVGRWTYEHELIAKILQPDGIVLTFGWTSQGMGIQNLFTIDEILLVCHGGAHNDTICTAERKVAHQIPLCVSSI